MHADPPCRPADRVSRPVPLLEDGSLSLRVHPALASAAAAWIPLAPPARVASADRGVCIRVTPARPGSFRVPRGEPALELLSVRGWLDAAGEKVRLAGAEGGIRGTVDLRRGRASLVAPVVAPDSRANETALACALTIAAALLLGRQGRALLHAGAVVAPDGRAWLLVGDPFSGKSTTCATLVRAGWDWLADDQLVAAADPATGGVRVEGWPRRFLLDDGYGAGVPTGRRAPADPAALGPGRWRRTAPLAGVLLPRVQADQPTRLEPAHPADALSRLVRQSPWLLADPRAAPRLLELLSKMAKLSVFGLRLGADTFAEPLLLHGSVAGELMRRGA